MGSKGRPFNASFWSWFHKAEKMGLEVVTFVLDTRSGAVAGISFAGKATTGVVLREYLVNAVPTNLPALFVSTLDN